TRRCSVGRSSQASAPPRHTGAGCSPSRPRGDGVNLPGAPPPRLPELTRAQDRLTFLYLERSVVHRDANAITATDERGTVHIPAATLGALLLGPGVTVSHQAMMLLAESG